MDFHTIPVYGDLPFLAGGTRNHWGINFKLYVSSLGAMANATRSM